MLWDLTSPYDSLLRKWSKTRQDFWDECERKYFYRYCAALTGSRHPLKSEIQRLRRKNTISHRIGEIVHAAIADYIRDESLPGRAASISPILDKRWRQYMETPGDSLLEFTNGHGLTSVLIEQARAECQKLLGDFIAIWSEYRGQEILHIDDPADHPGWFWAGGNAVYARPPLIVKQDRYRVIHWKTGEEPDDYADNNLEMSASIFLACYDYNGDCRRSPDELEGVFYYLPARKQSHVIIRTSDDFDQFSDYVDEKLGLIAESLVEEHYATDPARWKCKSCKFAIICHDGKRLLDI